MQTFGEDSYRYLLDLVRRHGWRCAHFGEDVAAEDRVLWLRHDVDYSVELALHLARVNAELGVCGTFFLLLRSDVYNLLAPANRTAARAIHQAGQALALHCPAPDPVPEDIAQVRAAVMREHQLLHSELPMIEPVFSWHNPTAELLERYGGLEVPGLVNAYAPRFTAGAVYRSDSNFRTSVAEFAELLARDDLRRLHLLFHPVNWTVGGHDMIAVLAGTWKAIIRERERDARTNRVYHEALPAGMPESLLDDFARSWEQAARRGAVAGRSSHAA
jgi:hypothetical protein